MSLKKKKSDGKLYFVYFFYEYPTPFLNNGRNNIITR